MKKIIATTAAALTLSLGALISPAAADEAAAPTCEQYLTESNYRQSVLNDQLKAMQVAARVTNRDLIQAERKIARQHKTIARLRAALARR